MSSSTNTSSRNGATRTIDTDKNRDKQHHWNNSSNAETAAANMARCAQIKECQAQIKHWKQKLGTLKHQHKLAATLAALQRDPMHWKTLSHKQKWKKEHVLAVLRQNNSENKHPASSSIPPGQRLPDPFLESNWEGSVPKNLKCDKDVFLARIATRHCRRYYCAPPPFPILQLGESPQPSERKRRLVVPEALRNDKDVLLKVLESYPMVLMQHVEDLSDDSTVKSQKNSHWLSDYEGSIWDDVDLFSAFCRGFAQCCSGSTGGFDMLHGENLVDDESDDVGYASVLHWNNESFKDTLSRFSVTMRNDPDVILDIIKPYRDFDFCRCFLQTCQINNSEPTTDKNNKINAWLRNNTSFALKVVEMLDEIPDNALKFFSRRLRENEEVVRKIVQKNGKCLKFASYGLRKDLAIVTVACESDPRALIYCIPRSSTGTKSKLQDNRQCVLDFFRQIHKESKEMGDVSYSIAAKAADIVVPPNSTLAMNRRLWKNLKPALKSDHEIAILAWLSGCIAVEELPSWVRSSRRFWMSAIATRSEAWNFLPNRLKRDVAFVSAIVSFQDFDIVTQIFARFPHLMQDRAIWLKIVSQPSFMTHLLIENAPAEILQDREIVIQACRQNHEVWDLLDSPLMEDRDVVAAALEHSPDVLLDLPDFVQAMYPDLVAQAIRRFATDDVWEIFDSIDEDLWTNIDVARAWVSNGGDYLHEEFPEEFEDDEELFLLIAEHMPQDFWCSSEELCDNKDFMMKVVKMNPLLFKETSNRLCKDFELALVAFGGDDDDIKGKATISRSDLAGSYDMNDKDEFEFITGFAKKVRKKLETHDTFVRQILCGMSSSSNDRKMPQKCNLRLLNQGNETALAYKKTLAEYLGVPIGTELRMLRRASINLCRWGY